MDTSRNFGPIDAGDMVLRELADRGICEAYRHQDPVDFMFKLAKSAIEAKPYFAPNPLQPDSCSVALLVERVCVICGKSDARIHCTGLISAQLRQKNQVLDLLEEVESQWIEQATENVPSICCESVTRVEPFF